MSEEILGVEWAALLGRGLTASHEPILLVDGETCILLASQGAGGLLGYSPEELTGRPLSSFIFPPPNIAQLRLEGHDQDGRPIEMELQDARGAVIPVQAHCDVFSLGGRRYCFLVIHDLSRNEVEEQERVARLAKLSLLNQLSEALHGAQLTLDQILEAVLICVTAGQGLRFNRAFLLLVDEQNVALRGEIAIGPSNREEAARIWHDLAGRQFDLFEMIDRYEERRQRLDVAVNEIVRHMSVPLNQSDHILIRAMSGRMPYRVAHDTRLPGVDDLRLWLECSSFAVVPLITRRGPLGVIVADNAISGKEITPLDLEFLQLFADKSANAIENSRLYHELERRLVDLRKAARRQKEDQELLLRMERLSVMGETSAIVAHELRNPLVAIGGFARTLERNLAADDANKQYAAIIIEEVERLERIIHDLLDFIRPQKLLRKSVVMDELVGETARRYATQLQEQGIELRLDLEGGNTRIRVNPGEIQQVVQNLVVNASQALGAGGQINVATRVHEGRVEISVLDTGPGIPEDLLEKIFTPFFTTKASGSGLGLTICAQIAKAHGGELSVRRCLPRGAAFTLVVPLPKPVAHPV